MHVLRGAKVIDGTGAPGRAGEVVVDGDRIVAVGEPGTGRGEVVDLDGLVLAPGFVDCHTHYDAQVLWDPDLTPSSWHGITSVVMGNCGFGVAPTLAGAREEIARTLENVEGMSLDALLAGIEWDFTTFPEYLDSVRRRRPRLNTAVMVGHTPVRLFVMGDAATERPATDVEIARMRAIVGEAMDAGAIGFATSQQPAHVGAHGRPVPSRLAAPDEIFQLAEELRVRARGIIAITHGPGFGMERIAELARRSERPVTWTALSASGRSPSAPDQLRLQESLGGEVWPQVSCRPIVFQVTLADPAPLAREEAFREVLELPPEERPGLYRDPGWRARARSGSRTSAVDWYRVTVQESGARADLLDGPSIGALADLVGASPVEVACDIALADGLRTRFRVEVANHHHAELAATLTDRRALLGLSDAGAHASQLCDAVFSTFLLEHWVRETGTLSLEEAVWRLSGHPASVFRLADRGRIATGCFADLVAFDPATVGARRSERVWDLPAGSDRLVAHSDGIVGTWVNGVRTWDEGALCGTRPGRVLAPA